MTRRPLDAYYTPDDVALACVDYLGRWLAPHHCVVEPSVGGGAFVRALLARGHTGGITGIDIDPDAPGLALCDYRVVGDFLRVPDGASWIIGNPPYSQAEAHWTAATNRASFGVAMLLRLAFLAGQGRRSRIWSAPGLRAVYVLPKRPSFTDGGTDSADYAWFVWLRGYEGAPELAWMDL